jgi:hypothetical protein
MPTEDGASPSARTNVEDDGGGIAPPYQPRREPGPRQRTDGSAGAMSGRGTALGKGCYRPSHPARTGPFGPVETPPFLRRTRVDFMF